MATIVLTTLLSSSTPAPDPLFARRDTVDILVQILKATHTHSKIFGIKNTVCPRSRNRRVIELLALLCRFGLLTDESQFQDNNKKNIRYNIRVVKHYRVTEKGYALISIYDSMLAQFEF